MKKHSNPALQRPAAQRTAPKPPVTKEAMQRVQSRTAAVNGGKQSGWTRRLQSAVDRRAAGSAVDPTPDVGDRGAAGQHAEKAAGGKRSA